jgi:hypothetical protein
MQNERNVRMYDVMSKNRCSPGLLLIRAPKQA